MAEILKSTMDGVRRWRHSVAVDSVLADGLTGEIAITVFAGSGDAGPRVLAFGFPGGGYTRAYFDIERSELDGPGQAATHAGRGWVFVSCDPLGGGDSTPLPDSACGLDASAHAADLVVRTVRDRLRTGSLSSELEPIDIGATIGIGHSLGGMQLIHQQGMLGTFDAVAVLGFSATQTLVPAQGSDGLTPHDDPDEPLSDLSAAWSGPLSDDLAHLRHAYHWEDVAPTLVAADMSVGFPVRTADVLPPWISRTFPPFAAICLAPGVVAPEAGRISVPVLIGAGERDVLGDLRSEAAAYQASSHVTLVEVPRCAHMHNFSPQRQVLWDALHRWGDTIPAADHQSVEGAPVGAG